MTISDKCSYGIVVEEKIKKLISQLGSPDESVRKRAMSDLSGTKDPDEVKCLASYITHKDNLVRYSVRKALKDIQARGGLEFGNITISSASSKSKSDFGVKSGKTAILLFILIIVQCGAVYYFYFKADKQNSNVSDFFSLSMKAGANSKNIEDYNVIRQDEKGAPILKIKGLVLQLNKIKREALILFGSQGNSSVVRFPDGIKMNLEPATNVEIEGELLRNDNIGPVLIKCRKIKTLKNNWRKHQ